MITSPALFEKLHDEGYSHKYHSGIQLIDFNRDSLTLRGAAPHKGRARRAFLHNGSLFAMSDERVEAFDISDRDNLVLLSGVKTVHKTYRCTPVGGWTSCT